jgi:uncharacterized membrane protein
MVKTSKHIRNIYNWYLFILGLICFLPMAAPVLLKLSESSSIFTIPAKVIYFAYSFTCHQLAWRSIHVFDFQFAWCSRDTGIWLGIFLAALLVRTLKLKGLRWYWIIPFVIPIAMDGIIQTVATAVAVDPIGATGSVVYISSNLVRFITGSLFGLGVSLWMSPIMAEIFDPTYQKLAEQGGKLRDGLAQWKLIGIIVAGLVIIYVTLITTWTLTSKEVLPSDLLDSAVKTPSTDFYTRRENGACPVTVQDLFSFDCLQQN